MYKDNIIFIGLDTHKTFTQVAVLKDHRGTKPEALGKINTNKSSFIKLARQLQSKYPKATLHFIYEAGPCGYWIYRLLTSLNHYCYIVVPSLNPKKAGERVKTDKRDLSRAAIRRFDHPRKLMAYLGLVSNESSSGDKRRLGKLTKCGNGRARRLLIEGAHTYKYKVNISTELQKRQEGLSKKLLILHGKRNLGYAVDISVSCKKVNTVTLLLPL